MNFLDRYRNGEHEAVWAELVAMGPAALSEWREPALEVVRETMMRVRGNLELLTDALTRNGFQFGIYPDGEVVPAYHGPMTPPDPDVDVKVAELETLIGGRIPLSIYGFWKWVGSVCFVGYRNNWCDYSDPLWIEGPAISLSEFPDWQDDEPFGLVLAPDIYHKDNVSGGAPYELPVPAAAIDAMLRNTPDDTHFVSYLRNAIAWCGFPGFEAAEMPLPEWLTRVKTQLRAF